MHTDKTGDDDREPFQQLAAARERLAALQSSWGHGYLSGAVERSAARDVADCFCREAAVLLQETPDAVGLQAVFDAATDHAPAAGVEVHAVGAAGQRLATQMLSSWGVLLDQLPAGGGGWTPTRRVCWPVVLALQQLQGEADHIQGGGCLWADDGGLAVLSLQQAAALAEGADKPPQLLRPADIDAVGSRQAQAQHGRQAPVLAGTPKRAAPLLLPPPSAAAAAEQMHAPALLPSAEEAASLPPGSADISGLLPAAGVMAKPAGPTPAAAGDQRQPEKLITISRRRKREQLQTDTAGAAKGVPGKTVHRPGPAAAMAVGQLASSSASPIAPTALPGSRQPSPQERRIAVQAVLGSLAAFRAVFTDPARLPLIGQFKQKEAASRAALLQEAERGLRKWSGERRRCVPPAQLPATQATTVDGAGAARRGHTLRAPVQQLAAEMLRDQLPRLLAYAPRGADGQPQLPEVLHLAGRADQVLLRCCPQAGGNPACLAVHVEGLPGLVGAGARVRPWKGHGLAL